MGGCYNYGVGVQGCLMIFIPLLIIGAFCTLHLPVTEDQVLEDLNNMNGVAEEYNYDDLFEKARLKLLHNHDYDRVAYEDPEPEPQPEPVRQRPASTVDLNPLGSKSILPPAPSTMSEQSVPVFRQASNVDFTPLGNKRADV